MIVGTAGHIDHGKTTLVRAITGVDTDRLKEERERGISIELGYAYIISPQGASLGFIDVPGHERLIRTMVAGASGIDCALLVIAADDGIMPQTREHLEILQLLAVGEAVIAVTKVDRVSAARLHEVQCDIRALLAATSYSSAPLFPMDCRDPSHPGVLTLTQYLHQRAAASPARCADGLFRLAIDRVFTLPGRGTIAAGTVISGRVCVGERVTLMPAGLEAKVRSLHAHNRESSVALAGQRCALNLTGIDRCAINRGDWLGDVRALSLTSRIDVRLWLLERADVRLQSWSPVHVHHGTAHRLAHVVPLDCEQIRAGTLARVQLVLDVPICALPGDRLIVRDARASSTIGGAVVLDPFAPVRKRRCAERMAYLDAVQRLLDGEGIGAVLRLSSAGVPLSTLIRLTGQPAERISLPPDAVQIDAGHDRYVLTAQRHQELNDRIVAQLRLFHEQCPDEPGCDLGRLRRMTDPSVPEALWRALLSEQIASGRIMRSGAWLHLPGHSAVLTAEEQQLAQCLRPLIAAGGFDPPWVRDLAAQLQQSPEQVRAVLRKQVVQGVLFQVVRDLFYDRDRMLELAALAQNVAHRHGAVDAARYRDTIGLGRKRAVQILEFFDRVGYTRRVRDQHVLRPDSGWCGA